MVATSPDWRGWLALAVFALQNGTDAIFGQFVLQASSRAPISARTYALVSETCFKLPTALLLYAIESGGPCEATRRLLETSRRRPQQWAQISVPALLYTFGAVLQVVGAANLDAPVVKLLFQAKIPLTAACAVYFLGRRLSRGQWIALAVLVSGVVLVGSSSRPATSASNHEWERVPHHHAHEHHRPQHEQGSTHAEQGRQLLNQQAMRARSEPLGISTLLVAALCSAFASVYLEKQLKQHVAGEEGPPSLWLRNIQLSSVSALTAAGMVVAHYDAADAADGIMRGWDWLVWVYVAWGSFGSIMVGVVLFYADSILRGFGAAGASLIATTGSALIFGFHLTPAFALGAMLELGALVGYSALGATAASKEAEHIADEECSLRPSDEEGTPLQQHASTRDDEGV